MFIEMYCNVHSCLCQHGRIVGFFSPLDFADFVTIMCL